MFDPRRLLLQGLTVPLTPIATAVQGLLLELLTPAPKRAPESGGGGRAMHAREQERRRRRQLIELERQRRVKRNNELILAAVVASLTQGLIA